MLAELLLLYKMNFKDKKMENLAYNKTVQGSFEEVFSKIESELAKVNFGIVTQVALHEKVKAKLNKDMPIYQIIGVCNPKHAYAAVQIEENIGLFLPCKVLIKEKGENTFEVLVMNTKELMGMLNNEKLSPIAEEVNVALKSFFDAL